MGFLLTSYNSLPEQVEANKEKCKDLQTQINNIDTHEIEEVKAQVQTNTQNISNLTQGLGVTNTALNAVTEDVNDLKPRVTALQTKTLNMSNDGLDTRFSHSVSVEESINVGTDVNAEGVIKGAVLVADNDLGEGRFAIDDDGDMSLYNPPNAGKLITTGNIEEYAPETKFYNHNIMLYVGSTSTPTAYTRLHIINKQATAMTGADLRTWLSNNGYGSRISTAGLYVSFGWTRLNIQHVICGIGAGSGNNILCYYGNATDVLDAYVHEDIVTEI